MANIGVYSRKTLNDNWVEDRQMSEEALTALSNIHKKKPRSHETDLAYIGDRYDVLTRISRMPPRESFALPDDGFRERLSTNLTDLQHPRSHPMFASKNMSTPSLINTTNAPVCPPEKRPLRGPDSGFGAGISRHAKDHDTRFWTTSNADFFGSAGAGRGNGRREPSALNAAGLNTEHEETKGSGMKCGKLCGENHCESHDPAIDTATQRSWMSGVDPALRHIHHGGSKKPAPSEDNHLSLPIGKGAMSKIRGDLKARQGRLYRNGTVITQRPNQKAGHSIFQDD